jgi:hypothetical protein
VKRRVGRETIRQRADGDPGEQSDEARGDVHGVRFQWMTAASSSTVIGNHRRCGDG